MADIILKSGRFSPRHHQPSVSPSPPNLLDLYWSHHDDPIDKIRTKIAYPILHVFLQLPPLLPAFLLFFYLSGVTRSPSKDGGCDPANETWSALLCFLARLQSRDFNYWILVSSCPELVKWRRQTDLLLSCQVICGVNKLVKILVFWDMTPCILVDKYKGFEWN